MNARPRGYATIAPLVFWWATFASGEWPEDVLKRLQAERLPLHPLVLSARHQVERAQALLDGADGYFDTGFHASAGLATWNRPLPGSSLNSGIGANSTALQAGLEQAVHPGLFLSAGAAERHWRSEGGREQDLHQTLAGLQASVPLLRNRGHAQWRLERQELLAGLEVAQQDLRRVLEQLRMESDSAWIDLHQALADLAAYRRAGERVQLLLEETETLVRLQAVPEYQLYPSRMDYALREEEITVMVQRVASIRLRLEVLLGALPESPLAGALPDWADRRHAESLPVIAVDEAAGRSGDIQAQRSRIEAAEAAEARAREAAKADLRFTVGVSWQRQDRDELAGLHAGDEEEELGLEAMLVLEVPLQRRRQRAAWRAETARAAAAAAVLAHQERQLAARLTDAHHALEATRRRLVQVGSAVENARLTLEAESERFRLGEGRSRNVLDAQKDLTAAELRRNATAAALLQAEASYAFAAAYPGGLLPAAAAVPAARALLRLMNEEELP